MNPESSSNSTQASRLADPEFRALTRRKKSLSFFLLFLMFVVYFGFISLLAFKPAKLSVSVGSATLGIPVGIGIIIFTWLLTGVYVRWANGAYDEMVARLKSK